MGRGRRKRRLIQSASSDRWRPVNRSDAGSLQPAVSAYPERYELPDRTRMLSDRPGLLRPDAQATYDQANSKPTDAPPEPSATSLSSNSPNCSSSCTRVTARIAWSRGSAGAL